MSCLNSRSSSVAFMYTIPIAMHPRSGETSRRAHIPQKEKSSATATISRLSVERLKSIHFRTNPNPPPRAKTSRFRRRGFMTDRSSNVPVEEATATETAML